VSGAARGLLVQAIAVDANSKFEEQQQVGRSKLVSGAHMCVCRKLLLVSGAATGLLVLAVAADRQLFVVVQQAVQQQAGTSKQRSQDLRA
jgi:hypothetical protein